MRIWIDTDIGSDVDDALTLAYVLRHPGFELVGISTVFGDVELRTRIAVELLALSPEPAVPVLTGLGVPLTERRNGVMFGHEGLGVVEGAEPTMRVTVESGGRERIAAIAEAVDAASPDVMLAIGPLTNVAALAGRGLELPPLAIMGGKFTDVMLEGMTPEIGEWNWFSDPDAVRAVLAPDRPQRPLPRVVPADVTFRTRLAEGDVDLLAAGDSLNAAVARQCRHWLDLQRERFGRDRPRVALHDPLTAAVLVESALCPFEARRVIVDDQGAAQLDVGDPNVEVATDVDPDAAREHLMSTLLS